jgi:hypothetical protein
MQVNFFEDPERRPPEELLQAWPAMTEIAIAPASCGASITVVQRSHRKAEFERDGVHYRFAPAGDDLAATLRQTRADVVHVHGLGFSAEIAALARWRPDAPLLLQDHADRVPRLWRRRAWRRGVTVAAGFAFCSVAQAEPFRAAGLIRADQRVYPIAESTSRFLPGDRGGRRSRRAVGGAS